MKTIGRTNNHGYMVEMEQYEYKIFERLAQAVEGKTVDDINFIEPGPITADFTGVFGAIRAYAFAKFRLNEMRELLDDMERTINRDGENTDFKEG